MPKPPPETSDYLKAKDVALLLQVSERTVNQWIRNGTIPAVRIGRIWRIPKKRFLKFLDQ